jgi:hypothetical protein
MTTTKYIIIVGALQYLTLTRQDLVFSVNKVCQFLHAPTFDHMVVVKRILRYVQGAIGLDIKIGKDSSLSADYLDDWQSTDGLAICTWEVTWSHEYSKATISHSSAEAEYRSLATTTSEVILVQKNMKELGIQQSRVALYVAWNFGATHMTTNPVFHVQTKHIEIDYHFVDKGHKYPQKTKLQMDLQRLYQ